MPKYLNARMPGEVLLNDYLIPQGISQYKLAQAIGKSESTISDIINGRRSITPEMAQLLAKALNTSVELWLNLEVSYEMSKLDTDCIDCVQTLVDSDGNELGMYRSGGYVYSSLQYNDAALGRAVRAAYAALALLDGDDQEELGYSLQHYLTYQTIEFPGVDMYAPDEEHMHREVFAIFKMFLINAGENIDAVNIVADEQWMEMLHNVGRWDKNGNPVEEWEEISSNDYSKGIDTVSCRHCGTKYKIQ